MLRGSRIRWEIANTIRHMAELTSSTNMINLAGMSKRYIFYIVPDYHYVQTKTHIWSSRTVWLQETHQ